MYLDDTNRLFPRAVCAYESQTACFKLQESTQEPASELVGCIWKHLEDEGANAGPFLKECSSVLLGTQIFLKHLKQEAYTAAWKDHNFPLTFGCAVYRSEKWRQCKTSACKQVVPSSQL